jgi:hypothetical protein
MVGLGVWARRVKRCGADTPSVRGLEKGYGGNYTVVVEKGGVVVVGLYSRRKG